MKRTAGNCKECLSLEFTKRQFPRNQGAIVSGAGSSLEERGKLCDKVKEETLTMSHKDLNDTMSQKE